MLSRMITLLLIPLLLWAWTPVPVAYGQTSSLSETSDSSGNDNSTSQTILIGMFAGVIAILIILGIKSDYGSWGKGAELEAYASRHISTENGWALDFDRVPDSVDEESPVEFNGMELRARF